MASREATERLTATGPRCPICGASVTGISARGPGRRTLEPCGHETGFLPASDLRVRERMSEYERMNESERMLTDGGAGQGTESGCRIPLDEIERLRYDSNGVLHFEVSGAATSFSEVGERSSTLCGGLLPGPGLPPNRNRILDERRRENICETCRSRLCDRAATDGGRSKCAEYGSRLPKEIDPGTGVYCPNCGYGQLVSDGGIPEYVDDDLAEAVASIPDADVGSIAQYDDRTGHFVIESDADDQDVDEIDSALAKAGYERNGHLPIPGMVQQNFAPVEDGDEE